MTRSLFLLLLAGLCAGCTTTPSNNPEAARAAPPAPKTRPILCVEGNFQFVPGTWAVYDIHQLADNTKARMYFALDQRVKRGATPAMWIEVEVTPAGEPGVVTRFLAEETADGVGRLLDVIVQVEGYEPFRIPKSYLNENKDESPTLRRLSLRPGGAPSPATTAVAPPPRTPLMINGRTLQVYDVEGRDDQGRPIRAVVTEEVPPLALVSATTPEATLQLVDWGTGVRSRITGKPSSLWWWISKQVGKALVSGDSAP
jgi:hypothetical protein